MAESLPDRWEAYPHWSNLPTLEQRKGEIRYPEWFAGTWQVTSTLVEQLGPLAPDIVSPGFAKNAAYLEQPIEFPVRFIDQTPCRNLTGLYRIWSTMTRLLCPIAVLTLKPSPRPIWARTEKK
ncbi:hypothetical protein NON20_10665 [Synechocystis sp. B12]|nr:hypothetical protein NON20_10665 [Synechocystis sp. B12]